MHEQRKRACSAPGENGVRAQRVARRSIECRKATRPVPSVVFADDGMQPQTGARVAGSKSGKATGKQFAAILSDAGANVGGQSVTRTPRALAWKDVRRILSAIPRDRRIGKRDYAMLLMMATYGLGAAEGLGLRLEDIDWIGNIVRVRRPKTSAAIELPLLPSVAKALAVYLRSARPSHATTRKIFVAVVSLISSSR